ncbi:Cysteine-rich receptor-like protein kinase 2 [Forsythia ovata]|uniref:Cysteine-rich receptor-like protein kinase 2 n=1 Tax=Forsythia ovata TaxID=205694 RepID=A0ABD1TCK2_9LAMI
MENLSAQVPTSGFGTVASGSGLDTVHGLVQCYGDLSSPECFSKAGCGTSSFRSTKQGYARSQVPVSRTNESAYVLADCWRTLSASSCKACLQNAYASILGCLPWSEGRALNTGCFLRYFDTNFLNPIPRNGSSRGPKQSSEFISGSTEQYIRREKVECIVPIFA